MALIVQKYGGTSVGDTEKIRNVAGKVARVKDEGNDVVVVLSAMAGETAILSRRPCGLSGWVTTPAISTSAQSDRACSEGTANCEDPRKSILIINYLTLRVPRSAQYSVRFRINTVLIRPQ